MKNYYQKENGFKLPAQIYMHTRKFISCYSYYKKELDKINNRSDMNNKMLLNKIELERKIKVIESGLTWVVDCYKDAVWEHLVFDATYDELYNQYWISKSTLAIYVQKFVYGVAVERGEVIEDDDSITLGRGNKTRRVNI